MVSRYKKPSKLRYKRKRKYIRKMRIARPINRYPEQINIKITRTLDMTYAANL